jgi:iron-sulfur cluster repair protein YtfE (RIC family)
VAGSDVRGEITAQHAELRELVSEIEAVAKRFENATGSAPDIGSQLRERGLALYEKFGAHLKREQELVEPVLRESGPEGERRAERLQREHREQRELLGYLMGRLEAHPEPTILIARELQHFASFLRYEMDQEEQTLLSSPLLDRSSGD